MLEVFKESHTYSQSRLQPIRKKHLIFVKTERRADRLCGKQPHVEVPVGALHGVKSLVLGTRTLAMFKDLANTGQVSTDVRARSTRVDGISLVVNVDVPQDHKNSRHR